RRICRTRRTCEIRRRREIGRTREISRDPGNLGRRRATDEEKQQKRTHASDFSNPRAARESHGLAVELRRAPPKSVAGLHHKGVLFCGMLADRLFAAVQVGTPSWTRTRAIWIVVSLHVSVRLALSIWFAHLPPL